MTREEGLRRHRLMWHTIANMLENGEIEFPSCGADIKQKALCKIGETEIINCRCYCCHVSFSCESCIVVWKNRTCMDYEYTKFSGLIKEQDVIGAVKMANTIAELPERIIDQEE